jgi:hypothetical protein
MANRSRKPAADPSDTAKASRMYSALATTAHLCGLMQAEKRNMERMVEAVPDSDYQMLQNFLTHSSWDYRPVMDRGGAQNRCLGRREDWHGALY